MGATVFDVVLLLRRVRPLSEDAEDFVLGRATELERQAPTENQLSESSKVMYGLWMSPND